MDPSIRPFRDALANAFASRLTVVDAVVKRVKARGSGPPCSKDDELFEPFIELAALGAGQGFQRFVIDVHRDLEEEMASDK